MDSNRSIEVDRDFRRQVRRAYYLTRDDFESESLYNDYLEGVEDLIDSLINEETRPAARARLDELRKQHAQQTAKNLALHDAERRQREDDLERQRQEKLQAAQERRAAELAAEEAARQRRDALQQGIAAGTTSARQARADLHAQPAAPAAVGATQTGAAPSGADAAGARARGAPVPPAAMGFASSSGAPPPQTLWLVQPIDPAFARAVAERQPKFMQKSVTDTAAPYEADPAQLHRVRVAGGYDAELWRSRYRMEALSCMAT